MFRIGSHHSPRRVVPVDDDGCSAWAARNDEGKAEGCVEDFGAHQRNFGTFML